MPMGANAGTSSGGGGTPDDNSVTSAKIVDGAIVNADVNASAAIAYSKLALTGAVLNADLAGSIAASKITGTAVTAADTGTVTSAMITDGTIVTGDLNAAAGITSGQLAGSIAPSKVTGTAITAADTGSVTSTMITDGTILNADINASAAVAVSKLATGNQGEVLKTVNGAMISARPYGYYKRPTGTIAETFPRDLSTSTNVAITSGTLQLAAIELEAGMVISNFNYRTGGTGANGPTHQWACLADSSRVLVATSADATSTAIGTLATFTYPVATIVSGASATYTVPTTGMYYVGLMISVTVTMPIFVAAGPSVQGAAIVPILSGTSSTSQTTAPTFATTFTAITAASPYLYIWLT